MSNLCGGLETEVLSRMCDTEADSRAASGGRIMKRFQIISGGLLSLALVIGGTAVLASPAQAATTCSPRTFKFNVTEASVPIVIGSLHVNTQACQSSPGHRSSSSSSISFVASGLGSTAGWTFANSGTSLLSSGATTANYQSSGALRLCVPARINAMCSNPESFRTSQTAFIPSFVGPITIPAVSCVGSNCRLHFTYTP